MSNVRSVREEAKDVPVLAECEVLVCGGGPSGCAAALASGRRGAKTLLIEKEGYLGGAVVSQLVLVILSTNGVDFQGIWHEWAEELKGLGGIRAPIRTKTNLWGSVNPEAVKYAWDALLSEAGVKLLHHAYAARGIVEEDTIRGVFLETKAGRRVILADRVIDCTGDGILAAESGVSWEQGDGTHKYAMALTKVFRLANVKYLEDWCTEDQYRQMEQNLNEAIERGEYKTPVLTEKRRLLNYLRQKSWQLPEPRAEMMSVLSRILRTDPLDPFELTNAEREGREQVWEAADFCHRYVPGFENSYLLDSNAQIGIRSSRRLKGLAVVTAEDAANCRKYPDSIARSSWDIDIWPAESYSASTAWKAENIKAHTNKLRTQGEYFDVRYGCVVAEEVKNLLMAGRCVSAEHEAESSLRIQQTCISLGQAAGTAAALSLEDGVTPQELEPMKVVRQLAEDRDAVEPAFDVLKNLNPAPGFEDER